MRGVYLFASFVFLFLISLSQFAFAAPISATADKIIYTWGETLIIRGTISSTSIATLTATIYNSSGSIMNSSSTLSLGGPPNTFSLTNTINTSYSPGYYLIIFTDGTDSVNMSFKVFSEIIYFETHLLGSNQLITINTIQELTSKTNANYGELVNLSLSGKVYNGSASIGGKNYYFIVVDKNFDNSYDMVYIDDDAKFQLYNSTEDAGNDFEKVKRIGEGVLLGNKKYIVNIEFPTGRKVLLEESVNATVYSPGQDVHFAVLAKNSSGHFLADQALDIKLLDSKGTEKNSTSGITNQFGYFVGNFSAPSQAGSYVISVNNSLGIEFFDVEVFSLFAEITDLADNPTYSFAPNSDVRIRAILRNSTGVPISTATVTATVNYPNGTAKTYTLSGGNGTWSYDLNLAGAPLGRYGVKILADYSGNTQEFFTGFAIESLLLEVWPINIQFMEESGGPEFFVNAFSPNKNVTLFVLLQNASAGGMSEKGPAGVVDIDNPATGEDECNTTVSINAIEDDRGISWLSNISYQVMNISNFLKYISAAGEAPPPEIMRQCMVVFPAPNKTGVYRAEIKVSRAAEEVLGGTTFGVQRLYATANPVDFKGEDFWFYTPNSTILIKIKVIDLATRQELPSANISDASIIEMFRVWPSFEDVLAGGFIPNASVVNGTLNFTTPNSEGFYEFTFRFKANLGTIEEGLGKGYFMLKKYFIWGEPVCEQKYGPCVFSTSQNISIRVNVVDASQGMLFERGGASLCTTEECSRLLVDINKLENHQVFKEMVKGTDYNVTPVSLVNGTAIINISSINLISGWYGVELLLKDSSTNNQYFGWAGFEIRNFWVEAIPVEVKGGNLTASWGGKVYGVNQPVVFGVIARDPMNWGNILPISTVELESMRWMQSWPPLDMPFTYTKEQKLVKFEWGGEETIWIINITSGSSKQGFHQANVKATTDKGTDVGTMWFEVSSFNVMLNYRGMFTWPPVFASNENLTINITAYTFAGGAHNLSAIGTELKSVWDERVGRPIKLNSSTSCPEAAWINCTITANLSSLGSGRYNARIIVNDTSGNTKESWIYFEIKGMVIAIPTIEEKWIGYSDAPERELHLDNDRDYCDNDRGLPGFNIVQGWCINKRGEWYQAPCGSDAIAQVNISSNSTHLWINPNSNPNANYTVGGNFTVPGDNLHNWTVARVDSSQPSFRVKHQDGKICGSRSVNCGSGGCQEEGYVMTPPSNYSTIYHGYIRNLVQELEWGTWFAEWFGSDFNKSRPVYVYHNTTHVWMGEGLNFTNATATKGPANASQSINDPYGGIWKIGKIDKNRVELIGQNVLGRTGAFINTSLSKSGTIKIEPVKEEWFGGWDPMKNEWRGIDLDGNGMTNDTVYFAIVDNASAGVYDRFFFSDTNNLSSIYPNGISLSDSQNGRTFGKADKLTLLNIMPDGNRVKFYTNKTGEWADLGEFKVKSNIIVPIIVRSPSGSAETANVSIRTIRKEVGFGPPQFVKLQQPYPNVTNCQGLCELTVNLSALGQTDSGSYGLEITASKIGQQDETMEEWKWPRVMQRAFLVEASSGDGGFIGPFKQLPIFRYDWENYGDIARIRADRQNVSNVVEGVLTWAHPFDFGAENCKIYKDGSDITPQVVWNYTPILKLDEVDSLEYYFYTNKTVGGTRYLYKNATGCNFNITALPATGLLESNFTNITLKGRAYNISVLRIDVYQYGGCNPWDCWRASFGVAGVNSSVILPIRNDSSVWGVEWGYLTNLTIGGISYDVILANDSLEYPMCSVWNLQECSKKAWISKEKNFSSGKATGVLVGQNFTSDLYLASTGPGLWDGITVANFSEISSSYPALPGLTIRSRDNTVPRYAELNETDLKLDLNKDGDKGDKFYMIAFDDFPDGQSVYTDNIVDDDLNITEDWWQDWQTQARKDFYNNETGQREFREGMPKGKWNGGARFNESSGKSWEFEAWWEMTSFNNTNALLRKWTWRVNVSENVTVIAKATGFDQQPIANANVSVIYAMRFSPIGGIYYNSTQIASGQPFSVNNIQNVTDSKGYAVLKLENAAWQQGDYMVALQIKSPEGTETAYTWFRIEQIS